MRSGIRPANRKNEGRPRVEPALVPPSVVSRESFADRAVHGSRSPRNTTIGVLQRRFSWFQRIASSYSEVAHIRGNHPPANRGGENPY